MTPCISVKFVFDFLSSIVVRFLVNVRKCTNETNSKRKKFQKAGRKAQRKESMVKRKESVAHGAKKAWRVAQGAKKKTPGAERRTFTADYP
jgi:hypothetical protein